MPWGPALSHPAIPRPKLRSAVCVMVCWATRKEFYLIRLPLAARQICIASDPPKLTASFTQQAGRGEGKKELLQLTVEH